jgi:hypothetical protein
MKIAKLSAAAVLTGLIASLGTAARAQTDTYVFTATAGQPTTFDGSTITIDGTGPEATGTFATGGPIVSFDFLDNGASFTSGSFSGSPDIVAYNSTGWQGGFNLVSGGMFIQVSADFGGGKDSISISESDVPADPPGSFTLVPTGVPDASSTFQMLLAGMGAMGAYHRNRTRSK